MEHPPRQKHIRHRVELAAVVSSRAEIESFLQESETEVLIAFARNPHLRDSDLVRLLERRDLGHEIVQELAQHKVVAHSYTAKFALARHPKTPRYISLPLLKFFYTFDLLLVAQTPALPADVKMVAEEAILKKLAGMPRGQRTALARRGTARIAAGLLFTSDPEFIRAVLDNPHLTGAHLLKVLTREELPTPVVEEIAQHPRWPHHYELRLGLIRNPLTPFPRVLVFLPDLAVTDLRDICLDHRMPYRVRKHIEAYCVARLEKQ